MEPVLEREAELAQLARAADASAQGRGALALVAGEAGAGKTALVHAWLDRLGPAARAWISHCEPLSVPIPLAAARGLCGDATGGGGAEEVAAALRARVGSAPAIAVLEDLHWADAATLDVVRLAAGWIVDAPLLLVATYREDELPAHRELALLVGDLVSHPAVLRLAPAPLSPAAVAVLARPAGLDPERLVELTGGNPLLVVESIASGGGVPATVRDATLARARRLSASARGALDAAAAIGADVPLGLLRAVSGAASEAIEECLRHGVLIGAGANVAFRHELIRQAVESAISPVRGAELHARILEALGEDAAPARLAHHAEMAGLEAKARRFAIAAGEAADRLGAHADAARQYERALAHPAPSERERTELELAFGRAAWLAGREQEAERAIARAVATAARLGDRRLEARALDRHGSVLWAVDRFAESRAAQERAVELLEAEGDEQALAPALAGLVSTFSVGLDPERALALGPRALELAERTGSAEEHLHVRISLALAAGMEGDESAGEELARCRAVALAEGMHLPVIRTFVNGCTVASLNRRHAEIDALAPQALEQFRALQAPHPRDDVCGTLARSLLDRARYEEAVRWARDAQRTPQLEHALAVAVEALALARCGLPAPDLDALLVDPVDVYRRPLLAAARAELAWLGGDTAAAREHVRDGLAVERVEQCARAAGELALWARRCGEPLPELPRLPAPVRLELAGDWRGAERAWLALDCPYEAALALVDGDAAAARRAAAALHRLGAVAAARALGTERAARGAPAPRGPRRSTLADPAGLTVRERDVLAALARGATNREIAAALHLSDRTVAHHVSAVLGKLGAHTRTAAVAQARGRGMLAPEDGPRGGAT